MVRKEIAKKIDVITTYLFKEYSIDDRINLNQIANDEGISTYYDDYEDTFDGMFVIDSGIHHIHLNIARGNFKESGRGRFSLAHELGHYLIEDHHQDILNGKLRPHPSFQKNKQINSYEQEADSFAANILMPADIFYSRCEGQKFQWSLIERLSTIFGTSKMATLLRFIKTTKHELFIVVSSKDGTIQWFNRNDEFPKMKHKFHRGEKVPENALANEFIGKVSEVVDIWPEDWFETWGGKSERQMFEQCYYAEAYDRIITLLWYD